MASIRRAPRRLCRTVVMVTLACQILSALAFGVTRQCQFGHQLQHEQTARRDISNSAPFSHRCLRRSSSESLLTLFVSTSDSKTSGEEVSDLESDGKKQTNGTMEESKPIVPNGLNSPSATKFRRLKDLMWIRETLEDLTAAEFACTVESADRKRKKRAVDYDKLVTRLNVRIVDMCGPEVDIEGSENEVVGALVSECGMGKIVYGHEQRKALLTRVVKTRETLTGIANGLTAPGDASLDSQVTIDLSELSDIEVPAPKNETTSAAIGPKLYVRDDGTVDWDGALQDRAALKEFGFAVWARINGQAAPEEDEEDSDKKEKEAEKSSSHAAQKVTAKIEDTPAIIEARDKLNGLKEKFNTMNEDHMALLNSGLRAGQAVANVRLASLDSVLRNRIRESAEHLEAMEQKVSFHTLIYELERIYTYLATEVANPASKGYVPLQDRLNIAEFGLLESQVDGFSKELSAGGSIDEDVLAVVIDQLIDFKRRLGIDYYVMGLSYDREAIQRWINDLWRQTKSGVAFYVKGCRLFWSDIVFCVNLIGRAAQGYTLKPREVRNIRRTFKDIITFIPVVIILIIPLSPIGHVLVFGAIQRFFPDFFPSCFTEQRQNLLQLYESTEYSEFTINESQQEKISRIFKAAVFLIASRSTAAFKSLTQGGKSGEEDPKDPPEQS